MWKCKCHAPVFLKCVVITFPLDTKEETFQKLRFYYFFDDIMYHYYIILTTLLTTSFNSNSRSITRFFFVICGHEQRHERDRVIAIRSPGYSLSKYGMWIPVFNKTVPKRVSFWFLSKKKQTVAENQVSLQSLEMLGQPRTQWKKFSSKFYSSRWTSAFGIPLVRDQNVLVSDGRTSGSFLP